MSLLQQISPINDSFAQLVEKTNAAIVYLSNISPSSLEIISISSPQNNQILRYNSATQFFENRTLLGTTNQISVTHDVNNIVLSLPQNIATTSTPMFSELRLGDADLSHHISLRAPATVSSNYSLTFPAVVGSAGQTLVNNGSGILLWESIASLWLTTGSKIFYNAGNVGIGINDPLERLHVVDGNIGLRNGFITIRQTNSTDATGVVFSKDATISPTNISYSLTHRSNNVDLWLSSFNGSTSRPWIKFLNNTNEILLIEDNFKFNTTGSLFGNSDNTSLSLRNDTGTILNFFASSVSITTNTVSLRTNNLERMRVDSVGNVGINTSSPSVRLHVLTASAPGIIIDEQSQTANPTGLTIRKRGNSTLSTGAPISGTISGMIDFLSWDGTSAYQRNASILCTLTQNTIPTASGSMFQFLTTTNGSITPTEKMRIMDSGRVLIGTITDTGHVLNVGGDVNISSGFAFCVNGVAVLSGTQIWGTLQTGTQGNITSVGTLSSLTVSGAVTMNGAVTVNNTVTGNSFTGTSATTAFTSEGNIILRSAREVRFNNSANTFFLALRAGSLGSNLTWTLPLTNGTNGQFLQTDGTGILTWATVATGGTVNPGGSDSHVQFNDVGVFGGTTGLVFAKATSVLTVGGNVVSGGMFIANSDKDLKSNIESIPSPLELINKLKGYKYFRTDLNVTQYGLIAQELQTILPTLVKLNGNYLAISYIELIPILLEAIKELNKKCQQE